MTIKKQRRKKTDGVGRGYRMRENESEMFMEQNAKEELPIGTGQFLNICTFSAINELIFTLPIQNRFDPFQCSEHVHCCCSLLAKCIRQSRWAKTFKMSTIINFTSVVCYLQPALTMNVCICVKPTHSTEKDREKQTNKHKRQFVPKERHNATEREREMNGNR